MYTFKIRLGNKLPTKVTAICVDQMLRKVRFPEPVTIKIINVEFSDVTELYRLRLTYRPKHVQRYVEEVARASYRWYQIPHSDKKFKAGDHADKFIKSNDKLAWHLFAIATYEYLTE